MKKILVLGAGKTSASLINYLKKLSVSNNWTITIADQSIDLAKEKAGNHKKCKAISFDIFNEQKRSKYISEADVCVSLLPATLHIHLVNDCIKHKTHLVTASYVMPEMNAFNQQVKDAGLIFLNEMGLDPGIDHMDTMLLIDKIKGDGGKITSLRSYGGGLIAPESDDNPWGYKFTWNPMNVVTAGMASARYVQNGKLRIVPYNRIFLDTTLVNVPEVGKFEAYPNRDAVKYRRIYNIPHIPNVYRGSLRKVGFCKAWQALVSIGLTDSRYFVPDSHKLTYAEWLSFYLKSENGGEIRKSLTEFLKLNKNSDVFKKIEWLGLLSDKKIKRKDATPADILLDLLLSKWNFSKKDKDLVILQTEIEYLIGKKKEKVISSLVLKGEDNFRTAMSSSVGLPLAIGTKLVLNNKIKERGVIIPIFPDIYEPAMKELEELGIKSTIIKKSI